MRDNDEGKIIGQIVPEGSLFERIKLFQSARQLISYLVTLLVIEFVIIFLSRMFAGGKVNYDVIFAAFLGTLAIVHLVLPCRFVLFARPNRVLLEMLDERLDKMGYVLKDHDSKNLYVYKSKLPRMLSWDENRVSIHTYPSSVVIAGSRIAVKSMRGWMLRHVDLF